jgi:hypothetical protein
VTVHLPDGSVQETTMSKALQKQACERLAAKSDAIWDNVGELAKAWAAQLDVNQERYRKQRHVTGLIKAEQVNREAAKVKKKAKKIRRQSEAASLRKAAAEQTLANLLAEQASIAAQIGELQRRTDVVRANAQRSYGAVAKQQEIRAVAQLAKKDQEQARWRDLASNTTDPILRTVYLARAAGEDVDDEY